MAKGPACIVCNHPDRAAIEVAMVEQPEVNAATGRRWQLSKDSIRRHRVHLSPALKAQITRRESRGAETALSRLEGLHARATKLLDHAEEQGKGQMALNAIKELRGLVELLAKLTGELDERPTVQVLNLTTSPQWTQARSVLLEALAPYPDAAQAVSGALLELEP